MAVAGKMVGIVSSVLVFGILVVAGCQGQRADAPLTARPERAGSVPVGALGGGKDQGSGISRLTPDPRPPTPESPSRVTASETAPALKREKAEPRRAEPLEPAVELTLKFVPGQVTTYRITTEHQKSVEWKGAASAKPAKFTDGRTGNHVELTFEQWVREVQGKDAAVLDVTIKGLKYVGEVVNKVVLDFDSARQEDSGNPLAVLIGKSYQVKMSPEGQVLEISGVEPVRQAVQGGLPGHSVALRLLSDEEIRNRHEIAALSALKDRSAHPGQSWSSIRTFSFDDLGGKTYERVYTLTPVGQEEGRVAVVDMKAIPSAALAQDQHQRQAVNPFAMMSDNTDRYEGRLVLDLDRGQVREYVEQMHNEWIIVDPTSGQNSAAVRMAARRLHRLEQVP